MRGWGASGLSPQVHTSRPMRGGSHTLGRPTGHRLPSALTANNGDPPAESQPAGAGNPRGHSFWGRNVGTGANAFIQNIPSGARHGQDSHAGLLQGPPLRVFVWRGVEAPLRCLARRQ